MNKQKTKTTKRKSYAKGSVEQIYRLAQPGLMFNPAYGIFLTLQIYQRKKGAWMAVRKLVRQLNRFANTRKIETQFVIGFSPKTWKSWTGETPPDGPPKDTILGSSDYFRYTEGDIWLYLKSDGEKEVVALREIVFAELKDYIKKVAETEGRMRKGQRVLDQHFIDGITNPTDPATVVGNIIKDGTSPYAGSSWGFNQKFSVKWEYFGRKTVDEKADVIGRNEAGVIIPDDDRRSHIQRARVFDDKRQNLKLVRQALPYGHSGTAHGRERGIYFVAFSESVHHVERILHSMAGDGHGSAPDNLLNNVQGLSGGYWYIPNIRELGLRRGLREEDFVVDPHWAVRSKNQWMFYNSNDYLTVMGTDRYPDPPSQRILHLISNIFSLWRDHWYRVRDIPRIPHLRNYLGKGEQKIMEASIPIRKGMAIKKSLSFVHTNPYYPQLPSMYSWQADQFRIDPMDLLFGVMPELSLGRGKEVMPYLREDERMTSFALMLDESSAMGHIVPDHQKMLDHGLGALLEDLHLRKEEATDSTKAAFYQSAIYTLEGVQGWLSNYANLARRMAEELDDDQSRARRNLLGIAKRAEKLRNEKPSTFLEATQMVFTMHCCFHLTGNPVAVGRLDQLLNPFFESDQCTEEEAQEIIEAFWVKLGEKALHNRHYDTDHVSFGTTAVSYIGGNFPQGGGINQWVQQLTVGGYLPTSTAKPKPGCNAVTLMCVKASRRLPLNAPCLSLRIYPGMPKAIIEEAAKALLSGGAHPILFQEDRMVAGLHKFTGFPLKAARDFACDGCYEPMIAGKTEFMFSNVAPLDALELALNQGAKYNQAGPIYLRGWKVTYRSPHARDITSFEELKAIYLTHLEYLTVQFFNNTLMNYGNLWKICPSPMLSTLIEGCVESGHDLTNGGALYHIIAPMFVGLATTIDSLHAIKKLVFENDTAVTTLPNLLEALKSDWGFDLQEPWQSTLAGTTRAEVKAKGFKILRQRALALPKFGMGDPEVDTIGTWLSEAFTTMCMRIINDPPSPLKETIQGLEQKYSLPGRPWKLHVCPGIGTFEGYVGDGAGSGASADGRRNGQPYPSDFSPSPVPQDLPPIPQHEDSPQPVPGTYRGIYESLKSWDHKAIYHNISNASPVDLNIKEDFPLEDLVEFIERYSRGEVGSNLITVTCVDPQTYQQAALDPERYELVRVRMGGWTEYFSAMFPAHQGQHERRPYFVPDREA